MNSKQKINSVFRKFIHGDFSHYKISRGVKVCLRLFVEEIINLMLKASTKERPVLEVGRVFMYAGEKVLLSHYLNGEQKDRLYGELESSYRDVLSSIKEVA